MRYLRFYGVAVLALLSGCQKDISGTYLAADTSSVLWLQVVRTPDDRLSGQLDSLVLNSDGKIERNSAPVTGAVNARNVTISVNNFLGLKTVTLGGTLAGNTMTLSGSGSPPIILKRADFSEYQQHLAGLNVESERVIAARKEADDRERIARAQRNTITSIDHVVSAMAEFNSKSDVHLRRFPTVEKRYQDITAKMTRCVDRERELAKNQNAGVARSQLVVEANQAVVETNMLHIDVQSLQSDFENYVKPLAGDVMRFDMECRDTVSMPNTLSSTQIEAHAAACRRLSLADGPFKQKYEAMANGLNHLEQVYSHENKTQQLLLKLAEQMQ